jgi:hypothetical protein
VHFARSALSLLPLRRVAVDVSLPVQLAYPPILLLYEGLSKHERRPTTSCLPFGLDELQN